MKVAIIGSRTIDNEKTIVRILSNLKNRIPIKKVISGGAKGVDNIAIGWAKLHNIAWKEIKPDYKRYKRGATHVRNAQIVTECDIVIAFWEEGSKGTLSTLKIAAKKKKRTILFLTKDSVFLRSIPLNTLPNNERSTKQPDLFSD